MANKKIFILLPDGIGLRNFAFTDFHQIGIKSNYDITFWNNTPFDLTSMGFDQIKIENAKNHPLTDIYKNVKIQAELNLNIKKSNDFVYNSYRFPFSYATLKKSVKSLLIQTMTKFYSSEKGLAKLRQKVNAKERTTTYYQESLATLQKEKPDLVFCTNQRPVLAIAPLLAAQDLKIPTATFIFSWDNLPKATMIVEVDYYFVWSEHMKRELLHYYPYIKSEQVFITGTPQFEPHFDTSKRIAKEDFFAQNGLDTNKKYICYSGDDVTTCPDDAQYLEDVAQAIRTLNNKGNSLGILFRRCPVDFSSRYDKVLEEFKDVIVPIAPKWERKGEMWNAILPTLEDVILQVNTIAHTEMVVNLGSSMVFDYATFNKPCAFINYDVPNKKVENWSVKTIYNFVHFRSMPSKNNVIWINSAEDLTDKIEQALNVCEDNSSSAKEWFDKIIGKQPTKSSQKMWQAMDMIINNRA